MSDAGSDVTEGEPGMPEISVRFRGLIGGLPIYKGNLTELQEWLMNIQKKQIVYGLSDSQLVLLAFEGAVGPVSKLIGGCYTEKIWG